MASISLSKMKSGQKTRDPLRELKNNGYSLSYDSHSNESGLCLLQESPIFIEEPNRKQRKVSIPKKENDNKQIALLMDYTINLDSSSDIIDKSVMSVSLSSDFDWIKTPRSVKKKIKRSAVATKLSFTSTENQRRSSSERLYRKDLHQKNSVDNRGNSNQAGSSVLTGSKRQNVDLWLRTATSQSPSSSPVSLGSPKRSCKRRQRSDEEIYPEVEEVLKAVYGDNWQASSTTRSQTKIKKSRYRTTTDKKMKSRNLSSEQTRNRAFDDLREKPQVGKTTKTKSLIHGHSKKKRVMRGVVDNFATPESGVFKTTPSQKNTVTDLKTPRRTFLASLSVSTPTSSSHPEAQEYKINFSKKREELCQRLYKLFNSAIFDSQLPDVMLIEWNLKMRGTAGFCYSKKKITSNGIVRSARIELSSRVVDRADRLRDTLVHEMCHAAAWIVNGVQDGHGAIWLSWAQKAAMRFPELPPIKRCHNYQIMTKFTYRCTVCSYSINRQSRSIDTQRKRCGRCYGVLELLFNKKKKGLTEAPEFESTRTIRPPNRFALFVKENYKSVKESMPSGKKHADVMKQLGERYALLKSKDDENSNY